MGVRLLISSILYSGYVNRIVGCGGVCIVVVFVFWFEKNYFIKSIFNYDWFGVYIYLVKIKVEIKVEQKVV
jgi:hypothetical protein